MCGTSKIHISRIENGHFVASVGELEEIAKGLAVLIHELFYDPSEGAPWLEHLSSSHRVGEPAVGLGKKVKFFTWFRTRLSKPH
jgi:hypothetical protein